ncbi:uncharacterized protein LOC133197225 [Saccostrea echinata]|uniref:uncharacterized protein LOC133197225 n=1 Tax=Saccostrea echinata TaxID=191078 RepID=UPI002A827A34|nr:uncharacterized protein LOC133197225 [Saccostrea echinata]
MAFLTKQGLSKLRIISIILLSVAFIFQIAAVAANKWSEIDSEYHGLSIKAYQSLWTEHIIKDTPSAYPKPKNMEVEWKKDLQIIEIMCIVLGLTSLTVLLAVSVVTMVATRIILAGIFRALAIITTIVTSLLIIIGALLYNYQKVKMFSFNARNPASNYPIQDEKVSYGFILSVVSSVLLSTSAVIEISQLIIADSMASSHRGIQPLNNLDKKPEDKH